MSVVTRFAPSPTGLLHVGNLRTAVLNWLMARHAGGTFILRLDDTDPKRSTAEFADQIRRDLDWLGLHWDREERQSARLERYHAAAERLREETRLYECFETPLELDLRRKAQLASGHPPVYDRAALTLTQAQKTALRTKRNGHWRFLLDRTEIAFDDLIRGEVRVDAGSLSDPVLIRGDRQVLYTLASVVDDAEMGVTHVVRGADHLTNTATQIQLFAALGTLPPAFAHHSLLTGPSGEPLSKRLGAMALRELRDAGIEPLALVSLMARLGSSEPVEPITDLDALVRDFDIARFGTAPTRFDPDELAHHSARTLRALPVDAVAPRLAAAGVPAADAERFWAAIGPNLDRFADVAAWLDICQSGATPKIAGEDAAFVAEAMALLPPRPWDGGTWAAWTEAVQAATGRKGRALFQPLRRALTGRDHGPDMSQLMPLLRKP